MRAGDAVFDMRFNQIEVCRENNGVIRVCDHVVLFDCTFIRNDVIKSLT